ncbi:hypothetical protein ACP4OV_015176 [Aristida adscensionis]
MDWWKKRSIFFRLPYWEHMLLRHNLDMMHLEKNVCDNLVGTLLDDAKSKDNLEACLDLVELGIHPALHPQMLEDGRYTSPPAYFTMSREETLCSVFQSIKMPHGYASNISRCGCYPSKDVMAIVIDLASFFRSLCSKVLDISELDKLKEHIVLTLCKMEKIFVPSFFTISVRLLVHLVDEAKLGGPVHYRWMYPFERSSRNPRSLSLEDEEKYLFDSFGEVIGSVQNVTIDPMTLVQAHRYILRHYDELEDLRRVFIEEEKRRLKLVAPTDSEREKLINDRFHDWLFHKVLQNDVSHMAGCSRRLQNLEFVDNNFQDEHVHGHENVQSAGILQEENPIEDDWLNHIYEISSSGHLRRRRGPTKMADVGTLPEDVKIVVKLDWFGIPNSKSSSTLGSYMGTLVRKPVFAPLNILRWDDKCFNQYKKNMIADIESKFEIDSKARPWMLTELGNKWRQYKRNLKQKYYKPAVPLEQAIQTHPETVDQFQWLSLFSHWYSDKAKEISEKNKENAKNIKYPHTLGRKSFARKRKELEDRTGRHVNRAVFFYECHKNKQGAYTNAATEEKMNDVYMKLAERMISRPLTDTDYEEVMVEVFGKDHSGRVRGMGPTITPTNYYGARFWNLSNTNVQPCGSASLCGSNCNDVKQFIQFVASFMEEKYPEVDWMSHLPKSLKRRRTEDAQNEERGSPNDNSFSTSSEP